MNTLLKYIGVIFVLLGVLCLVIYELATPSNALLFLSIVLEVIGILAFIIFNKKID